MAILKNIFLILEILIYLAIGIFLKLILSLFGPQRALHATSSWTRVYNRLLTRVLGVKVSVEGERSCFNERGNFIVSNHLGYLDGVILGGLFKVVYVSKSEVKKWPLFGWMAQVAASIFIDRQRKHKSADYAEEATELLRRKLNLLVFPEGTSTNGEKLRPFQSVHFQAPLNAGAAVLPLVITYSKINSQPVGTEDRGKICWYGQKKFYAHIRELLKLHTIEARVTLYPKILTADLAKLGYSRKDLSDKVYNLLAPHYPLFK